MRTLVLALATVVFLPTTGLAAPAAWTAPLDEGLERARALVEEAKPHNEASGDPDASTGDRKKARRAAHKLLKEARALYDAYMDANPSQIEALDAEYCECVSMLYWIRKMASVNEFDREDEPELPGGERPPEEVNSGHSAEKLRRDWAKESMAEIREEERSNPGNVPHLHTLYEKYLAQFPDPSYDGFDDAVKRLGELAERMKTVFKEEVGEDPDAIKDVDSEEAAQIAQNLAKMLKSKEDAERQRAARLLGDTGSGAGAFDLCKALKDKDEAVARYAADGLAGIGGTRVAYNLVKLYRDKKDGTALRAVEVLSRAAEKSDVDRRTMAPYLARFVLANDDEVSNTAIDALIALGPHAGKGLVEAIGTKDVDKKKRLMWAIAEAGYHEGTKAIANYLVQGDGPRVEPLREAAIETLKKIGIHAVPHLIDMLKSRKHRLWSAEVLRQITGQRLGANSAKEWRRWWEANKPADAE
jgi:hypothetical protein